MPEQKIEELMERNLEMSADILRLSKKMHRYLFMQAVFSWVRFLIIIIPLALAVWYAPRLLKEFIPGFTTKELIDGTVAPGKVLSVWEMLYAGQSVSPPSGMNDEQNTAQ